jgi:hypothetical protein
MIDEEDGYTYLGDSGDISDMKNDSRAGRH